MNNHDYYLNEIKDEIKKRIDETESFLSAWKKVEIVTKKDNKPFKNMKQNFKNAEYYQDYLFYEFKLKVSTYTELSGYRNDSIDCYINTHYSNVECIKNKPENIISIFPYYPMYIMDIEDIKKAINDHIEYLELRIKSLYNQYAELEDIYNKFYFAYKNIIEDLKNDCKNDYSDIYYLIIRNVIDKFNIL